MTTGHADKAFETTVPGYDGYVVKLYINNSERGNFDTIGLIHPTWSFSHFFDMPYYWAGYNVNANIARKFCGKVSGGC